MTAPQPTPGSDSVREEIAEAATAELRLVLITRVAKEFGGRIADVLVPLVDRLRAEAEAEALDEAADGLSDWQFSATDPRDYLRARAAAYRTNPSSEETH